LLRLTLIYTPGVTNVHAKNKYLEQQWQDWGRHDFIYGIYGHTGDWRDGKSDWQSARLDQPLLAFTTTSHEGKLGKSYSLLQMSSGQIAVRAVKLAENGDKVIIRLQELNGEKIRGVNLNAASGIESATEVSGIEKPLNPLNVSGNKLKLNFTPYQMRSLALTISAPGKLSPPVCQPVDLPFDFNAFSARGVENSGSGFDGSGATIPAEMIGDKVVSEGIIFQIAPRDGLNAVSCRGQTVSLPTGQFNELYLWAASENADADGEFSVDGNPTKLKIQDWTGYIGQWDNRIFEGEVPSLTYSVTNPLIGLAAGYIKRAPLAWFCSHRRLADGSDAIYSYSYLFKYRIPLPPGAGSLTLPNNPDIKIIAATIAENKNDDTQPAQPLYDDFTGRKPIEMRAALAMEK
jgi:alpha-mannosidase